MLCPRATALRSALAVDGLREVLDGAELDGLAGGLDGGRARHENDGDVAAVAAQDVEELGARHAGHVDVGDDDVEAAGHRFARRVLGIEGLFDGVAARHQDPLDRAQDELVVVHEQDIGALLPGVNVARRLRTFHGRQ